MLRRSKPLLHRAAILARRFGVWTCSLSQGAVGAGARSAILIAVGTTALGAAGLYQTIFLDPFGLPELERFLSSGPPTVGRVEDARGEVLAELAREYRRPLAEHELPPVMRKALLAAEDKNFFEHGGVDFAAWPRVVAKVAGSSWDRGRLAFSQGGSTLTQQLVRMAFLSDWCGRESRGELLVDSVPNRLLAAAVGVRAANKARRKLEELRLALWLEHALAERLGSKRLAKEEIVRRYAMYVYLGEGRYGFAAGAEHYLGRKLSSLREEDADQAALLVGIVKSPVAYAPIPANRERALRRRNLILHLMERAGWLSGRERARLAWAAMPEPAPQRAAAPAVGHSTAVGVVLDALSTLDDPSLNTRAVFDGRIRVQSTIDARVQRIVAEALEEGLRAYEARRPKRTGVQGSAVVLANDDGRMLAVVGGRATAERRYRDFNRVTMSLRQAGSTMKPLVYLAALRLGLRLDSTIEDEPVQIRLGSGGTKTIANYDGVFLGPVTLRRALAESRNAATVRLAQTIGLRAVVRTAREVGIRRELPAYPTTALGASEVTLLELANAYRTIASGRVADPWVVRAVLDADENVIYRHPAGAPRTLSDPALPLIQEALRGTIRLPGGTGRALASLPFAVIGKTGTTNDFRDALFVGSTFGPSGVTMAVRIGFDDNRSLGPGETGGRAALPVFRRAVAKLYAARLHGTPPRFPAELEEGIDDYLLRAEEYGDETNAVTAESAPPAAPRVAPLPATAPLVLPAGSAEPARFYAPRGTDGPAAAPPLPRTDGRSD